MTDNHTSQHPADRCCWCGEILQLPIEIIELGHNFCDLACLYEWRESA